MPAAPKPDNEEARLAALGRYAVLDTPEERAYDDITRLVALICHAPIAVVNLIDRDRQFFKSEIGLGLRQTPLDTSICAHAILQPDLMVVPDTRDDERFASNPLVTGAPYLRFYAGALLETPDGYPIGTLCVLDYLPRAEGLSEDQKDALRTLARQVMTLLELRRVVREQEKAALARDAAEAALLRNEEQERARLSDIFTLAPAFMATLRGPGHVFDLANPAYRQLVGHRDILGKAVAEALPEVVEQGFVRLLDQVYQTGETFIGKDVPVLLQSDAHGRREERYVDFTFQRLYSADGAVSGILVHGIDLTDRKHLEQERERISAEAQALAQREALLNKITAVVRAAREPEAILQAAVEALGQGLLADRCYFVQYEQSRDSAYVSAEWMREEAGQEPLAGRIFRMSSYSVDRDVGYQSGQTHAVDDVAASSSGDADSVLKLNIRALLRVPIEVGDRMTALAVSMAHAPRSWTEDEIRLVENVATLLRAHLELARIQQRERNIAQQLQAALQPPAPENLSGLALAGYYQPALEEAGVGGDFSDVFSLGNDCTALVVADVSGKGLAAASQVAMVRNMLRYALFTGHTAAEAVTTLNHILVKHDLLPGFATLFVGVYDENARTLTYVNCGQEPGLIWHAAAGDVEEMPPTGAVLGGFEAGSFSQSMAFLAPGDILAVFTDGLTDVGPHRKALLDLSGVKALFLECCASMCGVRLPSGEAGVPEREAVAQRVLARLIAGVDAFARGGVRDDVCVLVGAA